MQNFWPSCGFYQLQRNTRGWLVPTDSYLRLFLERPELMLLPESCPAEHALHDALMADPSREVADTELLSLQDSDARESYGLFLGFRDGLLKAGSLESYYLSLFPRDGGGSVSIAPLHVTLALGATSINLAW